MNLNIPMELLALPVFKVVAKNRLADPKSDLLLYVSMLWYFQIFFRIPRGALQANVGGTWAGSGNEAQYKANLGQVPGVLHEVSGSGTGYDPFIGLPLCIPYIRPCRFFLILVSGVCQAQQILWLNMLRSKSSSCWERLRPRNPVVVKWYNRKYDRETPRPTNLLVRNIARPTRILARPSTFCLAAIETNKLRLGKFQYCPSFLSQLNLSRVEDDSIRPRSVSSVIIIANKSLDWEIFNIWKTEQLNIETLKLWKFEIWKVENMKVYNLKTDNFKIGSEQIENWECEHLKVSK